MLHEEMNLTVVYVEGGCLGGRYILMNRPTGEYGWTNNPNLNPGKDSKSLRTILNSKIKQSKESRQDRSCEGNKVE